jgi:hypothetical protein
LPQRSTYFRRAVNVNIKYHDAYLAVDVPAEKPLAGFGGQVDLHSPVKGLPYSGLNGIQVSYRRKQTS